jgi:hypothetical protein
MVNLSKHNKNIIFLHSQGEMRAQQGQGQGHPRYHHHQLIIADHGKFVQAKQQVGRALTASSAGVASGGPKYPQIPTLPNNGNGNGGGVVVNVGLAAPSTHGGRPQQQHGTPTTTTTRTTTRRPVDPLLQSAHVLGRGVAKPIQWSVGCWCRPFRNNNSIPSNKVNVPHPWGVVRAKVVVVLLPPDNKNNQPLAPKNRAFPVPAICRCFICWPGVVIGRVCQKKFVAFVPILEHIYSFQILHLS